MANHKHAIKKIRSSAAKRLRNRYQAKSTRTVIKNLRDSKNKKEAQTLLVTVYRMLDRLAKRNIIHKNNAANKKSKLAKRVNKMI